MESFKRKGRFTELMERIPVHVILTRAALVGAAAYGLERFKEDIIDGRKSEELPIIYLARHGETAWSLNGPTHGTHRFTADRARGAQCPKTSGTG